MSHPLNAAEALLRRLKFLGVDYLFANAGTDFAPVIEGYANGAAQGAGMPEALVIPHETAAVAMAHGYYLMTGRPQAAMVHVNVGLANSVMGVINAASDNVPLLMMAGRTPLTEHDRLGARMTPVQYGQEMRDQGGMVREVTKWDYELRYGDQVAELVDRALAISMSEPRGPVYLGLPREPLCEPWPEGASLSYPAPAVPSAPQPDPEAIEKAADLLAAAENPIAITQRGDPFGHLSEALSTLADDLAMPVADFWTLSNVLPTSHPMHCGHDAGPLLKDADVVLVIDSQVPWIQSSHQPPPGAHVIHIGPDPLFSRMPVRSFKNDVSILSNTAAGIAALGRAVAERKTKASGRYDSLKARHQESRKAARKIALSGNGSPMTPAFAAHCISEAMDEHAVIFNELGAPANFMDLKGPNRYFSSPYTGGLGWGIPAALGASLADRERLAIACVGDGSYIFANPVACHQIAESLQLPILTIVLNNGIWNAVRRAALGVYPNGKASQTNLLPITSLAPTPDFTQIAAASRGWSERVESGDDLPGALERAITVIRNEKRQALLELMVSV
ncbi:MAG: thiamine pyrophosphate-requiring protein [Rhodospirillales bacterium]|nr:thiamine pyrophosphate-requiring protein [Rhodospirillales bacterium]